MEIAKHANANNKPLLMNLSAPFISQVFKKPLMDVLPYIDVLFGNETVSISWGTESTRKVLQCGRTKWGRIMRFGIHVETCS